MMNLFARALGGVSSDWCNRRWGLRGRVRLLGCVVGAEGLAMALFSQMRLLPLAIASMMFLGLFVKMSNGANYAVVPFVNKKALGAVAGIVGAGGNAGAVLAGFLFKTPSLTYPQAFLILGMAIVVCSVCAFIVRFSSDEEAAAKQEIEARLRANSAITSGALGDYA
jgi:NNP family nitrate/nitrite transporter-like MFS transporter